MSAKKTLSKVKDVVISILTTIAVLVAVFTVASVLLFNRTDRSIFGFKFYICLSDSMKATDFAAGDLVISKKTDLAKLNEGDVISFVSTAPESNGQVITHKIREVTMNGNLYQFTTYGTTTGDDDARPVEGNNVLGKYVFSIPKVGYVFNFIKTTPGYICCILVPFMFLIILQIINTIAIFREYKKDEMDQIQAAREEVEKQMREIAELRSKLSGKHASNEDDY